MNRWKMQLRTQIIPESLQETLIKSADIPAAFKNLLLKNNNEATYQKLGVTTFAQYAGAYIAKQVINIIAFILTFIVVTIILRAVVFALDIVTELPGVGALNHLAGGLFGMGIAFSYCLDYIYGDHINVYNRYRKRNLQNGRG